MIYRRRSTPSLWEELENMQLELNRLFDSAYVKHSGNTVDFPAINVWTKADSGQVVTAEIPGMNIVDLDINVLGETLTISGARPEPEKDEKIKYHRQERGYGNFTRSIQLPFPVEVDKVEATYEKGILKIWLPRSEADRPRKIAIKSE
jgi:HSP20 family protein